MALLLAPSSPALSRGSGSCRHIYPTHHHYLPARCSGHFALLPGQPCLQRLTQNGRIFLLLVLIPLAVLIELHEVEEAVYLEARFLVLKVHDTDVVGVD